MLNTLEPLQVFDIYGLTRDLNRVEPGLAFSSLSILKVYG